MAQKLDDAQAMEPADRWKRLANRLLTVALIVIAAVMAWKAWQNHQHNRDIAAGNDFRTLLMTVSTAQPMDEPHLQQINQLATSITTEHGDLLYADMARLIQANAAGQLGHTDEALAALNDEIAHGRDTLIKGRAQIDSARLEIDRQQYDKALAQLDTGLPEVLKPQQLEARGDALKGLGRTAEARDAWQAALDQAKVQNDVMYGLKLKLDDLMAEEDK